MTSPTAEAADFRPDGSPAAPKGPGAAETVGLGPALAPDKLLAHGALLRRFVDGDRLRPVHLRLALAPDGTGSTPSTGLATHDAVRLLRGFADAGGRAVSFRGGGEPTAHPGYAAVCDAGHEAGLRLGLVTDGVRLGRPDVAECVASTHTWARVAFADDATLLDDVGRLRQSAIDPDFRIGFHYVIGARNRTGILRAARAARGAGAHYIRFETAPGAHDGPGALDATAAPDATAALTEAALLVTRDFEVHLAPHDRDHPANGRFHRCHYSRFTATVGADGHLYPCPQVRTDSHYRTGDVVADGWAEALDGDARAAWEATDPLGTERCGSCFYRPQNELLEQLRAGHGPASEYATEVPSTLHADFV
ncbi:radical SAM protein [Streptomyces luteireticuli]|uniref:radical SAM protein n=1 Tax=Streptomyces luteireticuli TaxID=173858 RepID=UPI0031E3C851